jgi:hypothetical protein
MVKKNLSKEESQANLKEIKKISQEYFNLLTERERKLVDKLERYQGSSMQSFYEEIYTKNKDSKNKIDSSVEAMAKELRKQIKEEDR